MNSSLAYTVGSLFFVLGSIYVIPVSDFLPESCLLKRDSPSQACSLDSALWYLVGCLFFVYADLIIVISAVRVDRSILKSPDIVPLVFYVMGSWLFTIGAILGMIPLTLHARIIFRCGSIAYICGGVLAIGLMVKRHKLRISVLMVKLSFISGSLSFVSGGLLFDAKEARAGGYLWLFGSVMFVVGSLLCVGFIYFGVWGPVAPKDATVSLMDGSVRKPEELVVVSSSNPDYMLEAQRNALFPEGMEAGNRGNRVEQEEGLEEDGILLESHASSSLTSDMSSSPV